MKRILTPILVFKRKRRKSFKLIDLFLQLIFYFILQSGQKLDDKEDDDHVVDGV